MNLWQSKPWKEFQKTLGVDSFWKEGILVLKKNLPLGKCFYEIQRATPSSSLLKDLQNNNNALFCRVAPPSENFSCSSFSCIPTKKQRFPSATRVIDLSATKENIFAQYTATGRRHIRIAEKNNIVVSETKDTEGFAELAQITAQRDGFSAHSADVFQNFLSAFGDDAKLLIAKKDDKILCGGIFTFFGETAIYYYGASSDAHRNLNAPTFLQWEAMKRAKEKGCTSFDLLGIAPSGDINHSLSGVTRFKNKFGGKVVSYFPESNIILSPFWYLLYRCAKRIRDIF